jgi:hypothetical protein
MSVGAGNSLAIIAALTYSSASMIVLQKPDALNKVQFSDCHYQIYGIEVLLTAKASGQVCFRVHSRVGLFAEGAKKTKISIRNPRRDTQCLFNQCVNWNVIAQNMQLVTGKVGMCHFNRPDRVCVLD